MNQRIGVTAAATLALLAMSMDTLAVPPYGATPAEIAAMPEACQVKLDPNLRKNEALQAAWRTKIGSNIWTHLHHYCHGLKSMSRASLTTDRSGRRFFLGQAKKEFNYVLERWPKDSPMFEEAMSKKDEVRMLEMKR